MTGGRALAAAAALSLGACALTPPAAPPAGELLSGRMTVRIDGSGGAAARSVSAAFELSGNAERGGLDLSTPLGSVLARARWQPGQVTLATPQGETRHADLAALTREVLGEDLPVAAMFDWLRGRPWPGAASTPAADGFSQLGWGIDLAQFSNAWVLATRAQAPSVTLRIKLDRP